MVCYFFSQDVENSLERRLSVREKHLARLKELQEQGRLLVAGPMPAIDSDNPGEAGFTGSTVIAEFNSLADAKAWLMPIRTSKPVCMTMSLLSHLRKFYPNWQRRYTQQ